MIATNSDITPSQNMVSMEYKHKLCKLKITIKPAPGENHMMRPNGIHLMIEMDCHLKVHLYLLPELVL
jgi:hypothetical protein